MFGESFLRAKVCKAAYLAKKISLWDVPAKSPDLNPVEMFWGWLRRKLRLMALADCTSAYTHAHGGAIARMHTKARREEANGVEIMAGDATRKSHCGI